MKLQCFLVLSLLLFSLGSFAQTYTLDGELNITQKTTVGGDADVVGDLRLTSAPQPTDAALRLLYVDENGAVKPVTQEILEALQATMSKPDPAVPGCAEMFTNPSPHWLSSEGVIYLDQENCFYTPNVGIGTSAPTASLDVTGNAAISSDANPDATLTVGNSTNNTGIHVTMNEGSSSPSNTAASLVTNGAGLGSTVLSLSTDSQESTLISATSQANQKVFMVDGEGAVWATSVFVRMSQDFPDYVFEEGYKLMSLPELRTYIEEHKKLPNMPSARSVEENGADLGELNRLLVEKIEELTLHVLNLQEQIDELKEVSLSPNATQK